jgi:hypothetical protein
MSDGLYWKANHRCADHNERTHDDHQAGCARCTRSEPDGEMGGLWYCTHPMAVDQTLPHGKVPLMLYNHICDHFDAKLELR